MKKNVVNPNQLSFFDYNSNDNVLSTSTLSPKTNKKSLESKSKIQKKITGSDSSANSVNVANITDFQDIINKSNPEPFISSESDIKINFIDSKDSNTKPNTKLTKTTTTVISRKVTKQVKDKKPIIKKKSNNSKPSHTENKGKNQEHSKHFESSEESNEDNKTTKELAENKEEHKKEKDKEQTKDKTKKLAILVDGSNFIYRAFYALPQLTDPNNQPVGAVYGFCSMLISLLSKHRSDLFCVALDAGRNTFRQEIYSEYKANRDETPEALKSQFPILIEACEAFGIPLIEMVKYEADDIIATLATELSQQGYEVRIIASDKDLLQLITDDIYLFDPIKSKVIKEPEVVEKYTVKPKQMVSLQALMGDSTDNIPGVPGVGPKTAAKLLKQFDSLESIYDNIPLVTPVKLQQKLIDQKAMVEISRKLVTLCRNVPIEQKLSDLRVNLDPDKTKEFLVKYNFNSLIKRLDKQINMIEKKQRQYFNISNIKDLKNFFELNRVKKFSLISTTCFNQNQLLIICTESHIISCFFVHNDSDNNLFTEPSSISYEDIYKVLKPYLKDTTIQKIGLRGILKLFPNIRSFYDITSMGYLLYGVIGNKISDLFPGNEAPICKKTFSEVCNVELCRDLAELMFDEFETIKKNLERNKLMDIYQKIDMPLLRVLDAMETKGILLSQKIIDSIAKEFKVNIKQIEAKLFSLTGYTFNPASGKQLSKLLFEDLNIPNPSRKKSVDIELLEQLYSYSPIPELVVKWRKLSKLLSTYTYSLCSLLNPTTHRLHTRFNVTATSTGRLSSSNPNLQNIPHRTEEGRRIRSAFVSPPGHKLISFDYSQIELRILAHMADIKLLKEAFLNNLDVHTTTASQIFNIDIDRVTPEMRARAKTINFGIIYGMSYNRLAETLKIPTDEAKTYIENYFKRFPEYAKFHEDVLNFTRTTGYVNTIIGRRCFSKDINSQNPALRQLGERQAFNAVIQGSAADIVKIAMLKVFKKLEQFHSYMIIQIHDELVFETPDEYIDQLIPVVKDCMENAYKLSVPLIVEYKYDTYLR